MVAAACMTAMAPGATAGFLKAKNGRIQDGQGQEVILRGMGLGGWMLQEGYMLGIDKEGTQHSIKARITDLLGTADCKKFYELWLQNHMTQEDVERLARSGFNSIRLPMHYNLFTKPIEEEADPASDTWLTTGFTLTDHLLAWCKANKIFLFLDLHAAPGGQGKDANISDYDPGQPSLWENTRNRRKTIALWRKLAERYAGEPWIGGYDLLNEPNWTFEGKDKNGREDTSNQPIWDLYQDLTRAIREVDKNHLIVIEGNGWGNNYNGFPGPWDDNLVLSFHKYWNPNTQEAIARFVALRDRYHLPLWLGESGENSNQWFRECVALMEKNHIGWAWWPHKKVGSSSCIYTVSRPEEYRQVVDYWNKGTARPARETAAKGLFQLAENLKAANCRFNAEVARALIPGGANPASAAAITLQSLLREMTDRGAAARFPQPRYQSLQASSYNRASTNRQQPDQTVNGWFADSDGIGFIRTETNQGKQEWVLMEHAGPGCITKMWTPFFWYDFNNHTGPNIRIYLDGADTPVIDESFIKFTRGEGSVRPPLATATARAGDSYLPIPFARSCKITLTGKSFYNIINYRAYPEGTMVETFSRAVWEAAQAELAAAGDQLTAPTTNISPSPTRQIPPGGVCVEKPSSGKQAVRQFSVWIEGAQAHPERLRTTVLAMNFDGEETVWCPVGEFFSSSDSLHPLQTWQRTVTSDGRMTCRWVMPFEKAAEIRLLNLAREPVTVQFQVEIMPWTWDARSMHFHANWRPDDVVPGTPFQDWNFIDIKGEGVFVGDAWTVLNIQGSWWGEGDEKIYVDGAWEAGFPTHFGTGTEDYYGWAGGEVPTRKDEFSVPFLANVRVGGLDGFTTGFNICTRTRSLDAIPFTRRLVFDMESSFGTDIRNRWNLLGYSAATFWYAKPGAVHNRPALPERASRPIHSLEELKRQSEAIRNKTTGK